LAGFAEAGKTVFLTQMARSPMLVIDADHRFAEYRHLVEGENKPPVYVMGQGANDPLTILNELKGFMPGSDVGVIGVDSLTSIFQPVLTEGLARVDADEWSSSDMARRKANVIRLVQESVSRWGTDVLWIWHHREGRDHSGNKQTTESITEIERGRLRRSLNAELEIVRKDNGQRGIRVNWSRTGRQGFTLWDRVGMWQGIPALLDATMYIRFAGKDEALEWAIPYYDEGTDPEIIEGEYQTIKAQVDPKTASEMFTAWINHVLS
jgi:hypothetical protein